MERRRFVVLDRDGTIIAERHYLSDPSQVELLPNVFRALRYLNKLGLGLIILTNQSGVSRGLFSLSTLDLIHQRLRKLFMKSGIYLDGIYSCPHRPEDNCSCRKPIPGLIYQAAKELDFDPRACFVIGDKACDIELGQQVGATTFLVRTGYGNQVVVEGVVNPDYVVNDVWEAAQIIQHILTSDEKADS